MKNILIGSVLLLTVSSLRGDDVFLIEEPNLEGVILGEVAMNGSGCRNGTVFSTLDTYNQDLLVFMEDYSVEAGGSTRIARKNCALSIPLHLPPGVQVALVSTRLEGFNYLTEGASSVVNSEAFIAGSHGEVMTERFEGDLAEDFALEQVSVVGSEPTSNCGGDVNLRINTSLRVRANSAGDSAFAAIAALGVEASPLVQRLKFSRCDL